MREGKWIECYEDGSIKEINNYSGDKRNGSFTEIQKLEVGVLKTVGNYIDDSKSGEVITSYVHSEGEFIFERATYGKSNIVGDKINYSEDGKVIAITSYNEDNDITEAKEFYEDGTLKKLSRSLPDDDENNLPDFEITLYYPNGNFKMKYIDKDLTYYYNISSLKDMDGNDLDYGTLKNGSGTIKSYTDEGELRSVMTLKNMVPQGLFTEFGLAVFDGVEYPYKTSGQINNGGKEGSFTSTIDKDGKTLTLQTEVYYQNIALEQKTYNLMGTLKQEFTIDKSTGEKVDITYYPSGAIKTKLEYKYPSTFLNVLVSKGPNGADLDYGTVKDGTGTYKDYDMEGKLEATYTLKDGKVVAKE